jgi:hypothetical protein
MVQPFLDVLVELAELKNSVHLGQSLVPCSASGILVNFERREEWIMI